MIDIRRSTDEDVPGILPIFQLVWDEPATLENLLERRRRWAHRASVEFVAEKQGEIVGWVQSTDSRVPTQKWVRLAVAPGHRRQGIATRMLQAVIEAQPEGVRFSTDYKDNELAAAAWTAKHGFVRKNHTFESSLELDKFHPEHWQDRVARLRATGLTITTLQELGMTEEAKYKFWELEHVTDFDIPGVDPELLLGWEDASPIIFGASHFDPAGEFLALDGDAFVGMSGVSELSPGRFYNQHTSVLREYRGKGVAMGLKLLALEYAKAKGGKICRTNNHSENAPMLAINAKLGYVPLPGIYDGTLTVERAKE